MSKYYANTKDSSLLVAPGRPLAPPGDWHGPRGGAGAGGAPAARPGAPAGVPGPTAGAAPAAAPSPTAGAKPAAEPGIAVHDVLDYAERRLEACRGRVDEYSRGRQVALQEIAALIREGLGL